MATLLNPTPDATMLSRALARWSLTRPTLLVETATSFVYRVERTGQPPAVLKLLKPGTGDDERNGGSLLVWYAGNGAAAIYGLARDAVLMELAAGETLGDVARAGRDAEATEILCDTVEKLHAPRDTAPPAGLTPLRQRFEALFRVGAGAWPRQARDLVGRATGIAYNLFDRPMAALPLHGDAHHDNIAHGSRGWVAIDPKGLIGDPAYDYANSFLNPERGDDFVISASRVGSHSRTIAARTGIPRRHLLAWASAQRRLGHRGRQPGNTADQHPAAAARRLRYCLREICFSRCAELSDPSCILPAGAAPRRPRSSAFKSPESAPTGRMAMKVSECMSTDVELCAPDDTIRSVARTMREIDAGAMPVGENDRLVGMITDRDICIRAVAEGMGPETRVRQVMSSSPRWCYEDEEISDVSEQMAEFKIRRLPVLNREKRLIGMISLGDVSLADGASSGDALKEISEPGGMHSQH